NYQEGRSYQVVDINGILPNGERYPAWQDYIMYNQFFEHKRITLSRETDNTIRICKVYISPKNCLDAEQICNSEKIVKSEERQKFVGYAPYDSGLFSRKKYQIEDQEDLLFISDDLEDKVDYKYLRSNFQAIGNISYSRDQIPEQQTFDILIFQVSHNINKCFKSSIL